MIKFFLNNLSTFAKFMLVAAVVSAYFCSTSLIETNREFNTSIAMRDANQRTYLSLVDAETGERGFLLTGREKFLEPYYRGTSRIPGLIQTYEQLTLDPDQRAFFERLRPLINAKLDGMAAMIEDRRKHGLRPKIVASEADRGRQIMDDMRVQFSKETERATAARNDLGQTVTALVQGIGMSVTCAIIAVLMLWCGHVNDRKVKRKIKEERQALSYAVEPELVVTPRPV